MEPLEPGGDRGEGTRSVATNEIIQIITPQALKVSWRVAEAPGDTKSDEVEALLHVLAKARSLKRREGEHLYDFGG